MNQSLALEVMLEGENVFLTGPAGSGKTYVLSQFIAKARASAKTVAVTATTGLAASHLNGSTIHAWSGLGIHDTLPSTFVRDLTKSRRETITKTDILVIDEISMLHDFRFDLIDQIVRKVRESDEPFGGIQIILCGDFFQLPPVNRRDSMNGGFVVSSRAWEELKPVICYLEEQHRQDDAHFLEILNALRAGQIRRHHAARLLEQVDSKLEGVVTELHTTNADVDWINNMQLDAIPGESHTYTMTTYGKTNYVESLKRSCLAPDELVLKLGALVICIKNNPERRFVNGSLGKVTGFEDLTDYPIVTLNNGCKVVITPDTWELRDADKKRASLSQLPLRLAWAITIHKSQGMTLDCARIDLRKAFIEGMGYVALSRIKRLQSLSLAGINPMALKVSPVALEIDMSLREKGRTDAERFSYLLARAEMRDERPEPTKKPKPVSGSKRIEEIRRIYPNAFRPWTTQDDLKLEQFFKANATLSLITRSLGRQPGSIQIRIQKHFGENASAPD